MVRRYVNQGFSGGEKKKNEILQLAVLEPSPSHKIEALPARDLIDRKADSVSRPRAPNTASLPGYEPEPMPGRP